MVVIEDDGDLRAAVGGARRSAGRHALGRQVGRWLIQPVHVREAAGAADGNVLLGVEGEVDCTTAAALPARHTARARVGTVRCRRERAAVVAEAARVVGAFLEEAVVLTPSERAAGERAARERRPAA